MTDGADPSAGGALGAPGEGRPAADVAGLASVFGAALRNAGIPAGPDRSQRFAEALTVMRATSLADVHACALATMVSDPSQIDTFERVFGSVFSVPLRLPGRPSPRTIVPQR
ncbi:MAG: hypothetical protein J2P26_10990, partial [Nocardiopsaceae bacterium]|nr:hypothetical protein [Nocardiopsaceae bacterium]